MQTLKYKIKSNYTNYLQTAIKQNIITRQKMHSTSRTTKLKLVNQANYYLANLKAVREEFNLTRKSNCQASSNYRLSNDRSQIDTLQIQQQITQKAKHAVLLYSQILQMYPSYNSNNCSRPSNSSISQLHISTTLSTTISYIHSNFLSDYAQSSSMLIKMKQNLKHSILIQLQQQQNTNQFHNNVSFLMQSYVRVVSNLIINLILSSKHSFAIQVFNELIQLLEVINSEQNTLKSLELMSYLWFGTKDISAFSAANLPEHLKQMTRFTYPHISLTIEQAMSLSHFIFNYDIFQSILLQQLQRQSEQQEQSQQQTYPQVFIKILLKCYQLYMQKQVYPLAFFTLRHLIQAPIEHKLKHKFQAMINDLFYANKISQNYEMQNLQSVECFRCLVHTLKGLFKAYTDQGFQKQRQKQASDCKISLFHRIVKIQISRISMNDFLSQNQRIFILQNLSPMLSESEPIIVDQMVRSQFAKKITKQIKINFQKIQNICKKHFKWFFSILNPKSSSQYNRTYGQSYHTQGQISQRVALSQKSLNLPNRKNAIFSTSKSTNLLHEKPLSGDIENHSQNHNHQVVLNQISPNEPGSCLKRTEKSSSQQLDYSKSNRNKIFSSSIRSLTVLDQRKLSRMVRICEHGAFLNKRNFNSDGGQFKFIKLAAYCLKWGKTPQKVEQSPQIYPLKDVKGILYGKLTPNLKKSTNKILKQQFCFSLVLQKRTLDFYCKDYSQVQTWVCGTTVVLKKLGSQIAGYTPGKMRWRKMFALLRQAFIEPLKSHQKNQYYFENAYSLILFKKNDYKLPAKV